MRLESTVPIRNAKTPAGWAGVFAEEAVLVMNDTRKSAIYSHFSVPMLPQFESGKQQGSAT
jgi:hypothetical protein